MVLTSGSPNAILCSAALKKRKMCTVRHAIQNNLFGMSSVNGQLIMKLSIYINSTVKLNQYKADKNVLIKI